MPSLIEVAILQFERDRADLVRQLKEMETGHLRTGERRALNSAWVDTTAAEIENTRKKIAELDAILARRGDS